MTPQQKLCQQVADTHYALSCAEDHRLAQSNQPVYKASQRLLLTAISEVYRLSAYLAAKVYDDMTSGDFIVADSVQNVRPTHLHPDITVHQGHYPCRQCPDLA